MRIISMPAETITKAASRPTYHTIRFLIDPERVVEAYRAYAFFRGNVILFGAQISPRREEETFRLRFNSARAYLPADVI